MTAYHHERDRQVPLAFQGDVIVCGAGPAGCAAALSAARGGARVALLEVHGCAGGIWTSGALGWLVDCWEHGGVMDEILSQLAALGGRGWDAAYDVETMKVLLEDLLVEAGVTLRYFTRVVDAILEPPGEPSAKTAAALPRLRGVITEGPSGRQAWYGACVIDATGNGDVGALAGCGWDYGGPDGTAQPMSLMALLAGPAIDAIAPWVCNVPEQPHEAAKAALLDLLQQQGIEPSYQAPTLWHLGGRVYACMAHHAYGVCGFDAADLTRATVAGRRELFDLVAALRGAGPAWAELRLVTTAAQIGIREGRRLHGRATVTREDVIAGRRHDRPASHVTNWVDIHNTDPNEDQPYRDDGVRGPGFDVPLAALIARDVDGLLMAGRCISGDFWAHAAYRVTGQAVAMGQSAGALALKLALDHATGRT